ncbi:hypothetical protein SeLEV6574_g06731 [Synchytrium endobioticum]|uniref:Uncharacterized protein n=1 Tax=Synchytrium endobioticum TaxID=286115 RepID=A0A507CFF2_9FUNG|nr:hypothetical protein SeLEV6574_g06731 [Synchytrium endobioticum]
MPASPKPRRRHRSENARLDAVAESLETYLVETSRQLHDKKLAALVARIAVQKVDIARKAKEANEAARLRLEHAKELKLSVFLEVCFCMREPLQTDNQGHRHPIEKDEN